MYIFNEIHSQEKLSSFSYLCYDIHFILFNAEQKRYLIKHQTEDSLK